MSDASSILFATSALTVVSTVVLASFQVWLGQSPAVMMCTSAVMVMGFAFMVSTVHALDHSVASGAPSLLGMVGLHLRGVIVLLALGWLGSLDIHGLISGLAVVFLSLSLASVAGVFTDLRPLEAL